MDHILFKKLVQIPSNKWQLSTVEKLLRELFLQRKREEIGKSKEWDVAIRSAICTLHSEGNASCLIVNTKNNNTQCAVRFQTTRSCESKKRSGRPWITTKAKDKIIVSHMVSLITVKTRLRNAGLLGRGEKPIELTLLMNHEHQKTEAKSSDPMNYSFKYLVQDDVFTFALLLQKKCYHRV